MKADYINKVLTILNEVSMQDIITIDYADNVGIESIIESTFNKSWIEAINIIPRNSLPLTLITPTPVVLDKANGVGRILLPDDIAKMFEFKMKEWLVPVYNFHDEGDPVASMQKYKFIRGNIYRPVCVIGNKEAKRLTYYSVSYFSDHTIETCSYIPYITMDTDMNIDILTVLPQINAANVLTILEQPERAKALLNEFKAQ